MVLTRWEGAQGAAGSAWGLQENLQEETDCVFEVGQQKRQERQFRERQGGGRVVSWGGLVGVGAGNHRDAAEQEAGGAGGADQGCLSLEPPSTHSGQRLNLI